MSVASGIGYAATRNTAAFLDIAGFPMMLPSTGAVQDVASAQHPPQIDTRSFQESVEFQRFASAEQGLQAARVDQEVNFAVRFLQLTATPRQA